MNQKMKIKKRIWEVTDSANPDDTLSLVFDIFILSLIVLSTLAIVLETVQSISDSFKIQLDYFEVFAISVFSVEYLTRLWSCVSNPKYPHFISGRLKYALSPMAIIDLLSIIPFFLPFLGVDLRIIRLFRLARIFRLLKAVRYISSLKLFTNVFRARKEELAITSFLMIMLLIISSTLMYYFEHTVQPEQFPNIPAAMWWSVATLTTVGYGDVYPITNIGRFLASIIAVFGIALFALPTGILGAGFVDEIKKSKAPSIVCPHCGGEIND